LSLLSQFFRQSRPHVSVDLRRRIVLKEVSLLFSRPFAVIPHLKRKPVTRVVLFLAARKERRNIGTTRCKEDFTGQYKRGDHSFATFCPPRKWREEGALRRLQFRPWPQAASELAPGTALELKQPKPPCLPPGPEGDDGGNGKRKVWKTLTKRTEWNCKIEV